MIATYVLGYCVEEMSDHGLALIRTLSRRVPECQAMTRSEIWKVADIGPIRRLRTQVLGLVGFARIARAIARKAKCLGLRVMAYDPLVAGSEMSRAGVEGADLADVLSTAGFISLHVALTDETCHLLDANAFSAMDPTAYLINTCRGEVIDEVALISALDAGRIAGAGLDVLETDPPEGENPLLSLPNFIVTPHPAYMPHESLTEVLIRSTRAVCQAVHGRIPEDVINPEVLNR